MVEVLEKKGLLVTAEQVTASLKATAQKFGLPFGDGKMVYNSRLAQEAGLWAQDCGKGALFQDKAFKAYFVEGRNIAKNEVVMDLMAAAGLDMEQGERVIDLRTYAGRVDLDWEAAGKLELVAAPTFIMGARRLVGARPYEALEKMVAKGIDDARTGETDWQLGR